MYGVYLSDTLADLHKRCETFMKANREHKTGDAYKFASSMAKQLNKLCGEAVHDDSEYDRLDMCEPCTTLADILASTGTIKGAAFRFRGFPTGVVRVVGVDADYDSAGDLAVVTVTRAGREYMHMLRQCRFIPLKGDACP